MPTQNAKNRKILNYYPAQIYDSKSGTYVGYYVENPTSNKLVRKKIKLNRIKRQKERLKYARELVIELNRKLALGWNPFLEQEAPRSFTLLVDAIKTYLVLKTKELREDSIRSYTNILNNFNNWTKDKFKKPVYILNISAYTAQDYLNDMYLKEKGSASLYNNHKAVLRAFWTWLVENGYSKINIFKGIKNKKTTEKTRIFIKPEIREQIFNYFKERKKYNYLAICYLTFYGLIRPKEICMLKSDNFDFKRDFITIPAEVSKTRKKRLVTMPKPLKDILLKIKVPTIKPDLYVFGENLVPNKTMTNRRYIGKFWAIMRDDLKLDMNIQFYGLKDSGIIELLRAGVSPEAVRDQAGHSSLEMTNKYVQLARTEADQQIIDKVKF